MGMYLANQTTGQMKVYIKEPDGYWYLVFKGFNFDRGWQVVDEYEKKGKEVKVE